MKREEQWILDEKYNGVESEAFYLDCLRLHNGEPLAYIIGHTPFLHTTIFLDSHPLIPRSETEFWVEKAITEIGEAPIPAPKVLDLCAGSGCIGIAVQKALPDAQVDFIEIDVQHHATIHKNATHNGIAKNRYRIFGGDLFATQPALKVPYDYILSNPPYIDKEARTVEESVTTHEPHLALFGGIQGFELIEKIISEAKDYLTPLGVLYIEHEEEQIPSILEVAKTMGYLVNSYRDQYGVLRYSRLSLVA